MTITAMSIYRCATPDTLKPLAQNQHDILRRHGVLAYRVSRFETGNNVGLWMVTVTYPDWAAYATIRDSLAADPDYTQNLSEIGKIAQILSRDLLGDLDF